LNKAAIIINPDLPIGILANAVACITTGLFLYGEDSVGPEIKGKDITFIPITKIPILILRPGSKPIIELLEQAKLRELKYMAFTHEAQSTTDYDSYMKNVEGKSIDEITLLGIGVLGPTKTVNSLVGNLPMLR